MRKLSLILAVTAIAAVCYADGPTDKELAIFTAQKYKADYFQQTPKSKEDIKKEYLLITTLGPKVIDGGLKDDPEFKIASDTIALEIWSKHYLESLNVTDEVLKKVYSQKEIKTIPRYNLHNILVKDESTAKDIIKTLSSVKGAKKLNDKFSEIAKAQSDDFMSRQNGGAIGWVEIDKLDKTLQDALSSKKKGDIFKVKMEKTGWQIIYVEDYQPARKATFDEAKPTLTAMVKQAQLAEKIKSMLQ